MAQLGPGAGGRAGLGRAALIACGAAAAVAAVLAMQWWLYGSPLQSGYGRAPDLFALRHVRANLHLFLQWLLESMPAAALLLYACGAVMLVRQAPSQRVAAVLLLTASLTLALYLVYQPFDSWTYLRFILPALAMLAIGAGWAFARASDLLPVAARFPACCAVVLAIAVPNVRRAQALDVFSVGAREARYRLAGTFVRDVLPATAVVVAGQHSASVPYYSGRPIIRADLLDAVTFTDVAAWARANGRPLAFVLDASEVARLRARLNGSPAAALDWPPRAEIGRPVATRIWVDEDRDAHRSGLAVSTTRLLPPRR